MARPRKYVIKLTEDEYKELKSIIRKKATSKTIRCRCQIILDLDESHGKVLTHEQSAKSNGVCLATITNTVTKYINGGVNAVTEFKRSINSELPYDPKRPVVCMDEKPYQLLGEAREPLPMVPGSDRKTDSEYIRNGTVSIFAFVEPLGGTHHVSVREHRTAVDWAEEIKYLVDVMYPDAEKIILVMDNLNTHKPASLYKKYPPEEARRIIKKLEIHYTPKHGSWLDIAEIELNVMTRQCLSYTPILLSPLKRR